MKNPKNENEKRELIPIKPSTELVKAGRSVQTVGKLLSESKYKYHKDFLGDIFTKINFPIDDPIDRFFIDYTQDTIVFVTENNTLVQFDLNDFHYRINTELVDGFDTDAIKNDIYLFVAKNISESIDVTPELFKEFYEQINDEWELITFNQDMMLVKYYTGTDWKFGLLDLPVDEFSLDTVRAIPLEYQGDFALGDFRNSGQVFLGEDFMIIGGEKYFINNNAVSLNLKNPYAQVGNSKNIGKIPILDSMYDFKSWLNLLNCFLLDNNFGTAQGVLWSGGTKSLYFNSVSLVESLALGQDFWELELSGLISCKGVFLPKNVSNLRINNLKHSDNLILPKKIINLELNSLMSARDLVLPDSLWGIDLNALISTEYLKIPEYVEYLSLNKINVLKNFKIPKNIKYLFLNNLISVDGLLLNYGIKKISLHSLTSIHNLFFPESLEYLEINEDVPIWEIRRLELYRKISIKKIKRIKLSNYRKNNISIVSKQDFLITSINKESIFLEKDRRVIIKVFEDENNTIKQNFSRLINFIIVSSCKKYLGICCEDNHIIIVDTEQLGTITEFTHDGAVELFVVQHPYIIIGNITNGITIYQ